ncbi:Hypothetical_protein [Hexamita inflata]|uniref:Hypothetical_protein n=1 Tax=Hexamita inflata TaxID=28002 RepID=A0AA86PRP0_9EUKA|nr:Hypothetical protein HINF_LOCUS30612 [Hexamita inflata]
MIDGSVVLIKISKIILNVSPETDGNHSIKPLQQVLVCRQMIAAKKSKPSGLAGIGLNKRAAKHTFSRKPKFERSNIAFFSLFICGRPGRRRIQKLGVWCWGGLAPGFLQEGRFHPSSPTSAQVE